MPSELPLWIRSSIAPDRLRELKKWSDAVVRVKDKAKFAVVAANNHYMPALVPLPTTRTPLKGAWLKGGSLGRNEVKKRL
jgi:hypothetical protein